MKDFEKITDEKMEDVVGGVSRDEALDAALKHAGFKKDEVDFVKKVEMDWEHGRKIYEICFYKGGFEYEYDIDAVTGRVLKFEKDWD